MKLGHVQNSDGTKECITCGSGLINGLCQCHNATAKKFDVNKIDLSLVPLLFIEQVALAFMFGEKKYGRYNFLSGKGMEWHRISAALLRHFFAWLWGEDLDKESGLSHLAHVGACLAMLVCYQSLGIGTDTRYKK